MNSPAAAFEPFTEEHQAFRRLVRDFAERELAPHAREWDEQGEFPRSLFRRFGEMGFLGIRHDPAWGGSGLDYWYVVAYAEELVRARNGGLGTGMLVQGEMATPIIGELGTDEQKREFLAPALRGEKVAALAISEPGAGSDVAALRTRARRDGDDLVISGSKTWISNGTRADFLTMAVRTGDEGWGGISLVTFPTDVPGFQVSRRLEKVGNLSSDTAELFFDECRIPARYLLGEENQGFGHIMTGFQGERLVAAITAVAGAQLVLDDALAYGKERKAFGRPIGTFQAWRHRFAEHLSSLEAARWLTYRACDLFARNQVALREISMAKLVACDLAQRVAYDAMQFHGALGYMAESDVARAWRDLRLLPIGGGTSEIMKELVARGAGM
jgi:alkylation response protein AidB-like acyl-CoA dehydrogenase